MFQSTVYADMGAGIPGELAFDSPLRATPGMIDPAYATPANVVIGRFFTKNRDTNLYAPGGDMAANADLIFGGILGGPKEQIGLGVLGNPFAPTMVIPLGEIGTFYEMGMVFVAAPAACQEGDVAVYVKTTGVISFVPHESTGTIPATQAVIPNAVVYRVVATAAGDVACIKLTN